MHLVPGRGAPTLLADHCGQEPQEAVGLEQVQHGGHLLGFGEVPLVGRVDLPLADLLTPPAPR